MGCTFSNEINDFILNGASGTSINDVATGCTTSILEGYEDRTGESVTLLQGTSYSGTIDDAAGAIVADNFQIWIDFNDNGTFESTESVSGGALPTFLGIPTGASTPFTLVVPASATLGTHRMRVEVSGTETYPSIDPCPDALSGAMYGEVHDYTVVITGSVATLRSCYRSYYVGYHCIIGYT